MSFDLDLQDEGILGAGEVGERSATPRAPAPVRREDLRVLDGHEVGVIAPLGTGPTPLLAARPRCRRVGRGSIRSRRGRRRERLGLAPEELLLAKAKLGLEPIDLDFELGLALEGSGVLGLVVGGLTKRLEILIEPRANRTRTRRQGRSRTGRSTRRSLRWRTRGGSAQFRHRNAQGSETEHGGGTVIHVG
jgi:hypothetical protein